jgi:hypothetical protein
LHTIRGDLGGVSSSTEGIFLLVGERLTDLQFRSREIAGHATSAAELLSNDAGSVAALAEVLTVTCGGRRGSDIAVSIREIRENAKSAHRAIQTIGPVVKTFDVLGVMTRIESARFEGGAAFVGLADAVAALSPQIREQIGITSDSAALLLETIARAEGELRDAGREHQENLGPLTTQTRAGFLRVKEQCNRASEATKLLGARFDGVARALGDVVTALQTHDIVRQQIEHILEALRRLSSSDPNLSEVVRLQAAQLNHSRVTFETSVREIREALTRIERNVAEVDGESTRLLGLPGPKEASFLSGAESDLDGILTLLDKDATVDERLVEAAASVQRRVSDISETIAGVHAIGIQMQRIALNATIQAAWLGPDGGALEIVANAIQILAREVETASDTLKNRLCTIDTAASAFGKAAAGSGSRERIAQLRGSAGALSAIQGKAHSDYSGTAEQTAGLTLRIRDTIAALGGLDEQLQVVARANEMLRELSAGVESAGPDGAEQMMSIYTMESERTVHGTVYGTAPHGSDLPTAITTPAPQEENVEFF